MNFRLSLSSSGALGSRRNGCVEACLLNVGLLRSLRLLLYLLTSTEEGRRQQQPFQAAAAPSQIRSVPLTLRSRVSAGAPEAVSTACVIMGGGFYSQPAPGWNVQQPDSQGRRCRSPLTPGIRAGVWGLLRWRWGGGVFSPWLEPPRLLHAKVPPEGPPKLLPLPLLCC